MTRPLLQAAWCAQQIRGARPYQEDVFAIVQGNHVYIGEERFALPDAGLPQEQILFLLADGMGGMGHGDIAARAVVDAYIEEYLQACARGRDIGECLQDALQAANLHLRACVEREPTRRGMGCTLIALVFDNDRWRSNTLSVGDSPMWLFRHGRLQRMNIPHNWRERLHFHPYLIPPFDPQLNPELLDALTSAVDGGEIKEVELVEGYSLDANDLILIASDGVETLSEAQLEKVIADFMASEPAPLQHLPKLSADLLGRIAQLGKSDQDNASLVLLATYVDSSLGEAP